MCIRDSPERFATKTNELCDELEKRVAEVQGVFPADAPRIMITGTPMAIPNWKLHQDVYKRQPSLCRAAVTATCYRPMPRSIPATAAVPY